MLVTRHDDIYIYIYIYIYIERERERVSRSIFLANRLYSDHHHHKLITRSLIILYHPFALGRSYGQYPMSAQNSSIKDLVGRSTLDRRSPLENVTYEFILSSPAMSSKSYSCYLDDL